MELQAYSKEQDVFTCIHYPFPIHLSKSLSNLGHQEKSLSATERITSESLSLPMYGELTDDQIGYLVAAIKESITKKESLIAA